MKQEPSSPANFRPGQHFQIMDETIHDPLQEEEKLAEPAMCHICKAVYHKGRWQWLEAPDHAHRVQCPACKRIQQKRPAGYVTIEGEFAFAHRDEILNLVHHLESREKAEHPEKRIMLIDSREDGLLVTTTDIHLAHDIGQALHKAFHGELDLHFNDAEYLIRVQWRR